MLRIFFVNNIATVTRPHITAHKKTVKKIEIYAVFHQKQAVFRVLRRLFVKYEKYSYLKNSRKKAKTKAFQITHLSENTKKYAKY